MGVGLILIILLAFCGAAMFACLGGIAILGAMALEPGSTIKHAVATELVRVFHMATGAEGSTLATIPLFTLMGYVLAASKTADRLVSFAKAVVGWFPGGLAIVTIIVCAIFTTVTGASGVTIVAVGGLVLPALVKDGYKERFALGLVTGTGSIGLLFPPALPLIIYGIVYGLSAQAAQQSHGETIELVDFSLEKFLFAGVVPGLVLLGTFAAYAIYRAVKDKVPLTPFVAREAGKKTLVALPELFIPLLMVIALKLGLQIPEAAAVTALYTILLEVFGYRDVKLKALPKIARESLVLVGAIFLLIVAATALTDYFVGANIPDKLYAWMDAHVSTRFGFLLALNGLLLAVGFVMDIFSAILVVVPLIAPAAARYHVDPYHLGVIFLLNLEVGYVHPPMGLNLFISSFRFGKPMGELYRAIVPFLLLMIVSLGIVTYVPSLTVVKSKTTSSEEKPAGGPPDAAQIVTITWPDGALITIAHCEKPEIKDDAIAYAECQAMFSLWARCGALTEPLDKMECEQKVVEGGDPFEADAAVEGGGETPDGGTPGTPDAAKP